MGEREKIKKGWGILSNLLIYNVRVTKTVLASNAKKINCFLFLRQAQMHISVPLSIPYSPLGSSYPLLVFLSFFWVPFFLLILMIQSILKSL